MSCALCAFVSTDGKYNNTVLLQEYTKKNWTDDPVQCSHGVNLGTMRDQLVIQVFNDSCSLHLMTEY